MNSKTELTCTPAVAAVQPLPASLPDEAEWPKVETVAGERRCYFGPFDLIGMSAAEFARAPELLAENERLRAQILVFAEICEEDGLDHCRPFSERPMNLEDANRQASLVRGIFITLAKSARAALGGAR